MYSWHETERNEQKEAGNGGLVAYHQGWLSNSINESRGNEHLVKRAIKAKL